MGSLSVWHRTCRAELVPTAGTLPGCLVLWGTGRGWVLGWGDRTIFSVSHLSSQPRTGSFSVTLQLRVATGAMGGGKKTWPDVPLGS